MPLRQRAGSLRPGIDGTAYSARRRVRTACPAPARTARRSLPTCPQRAACAPARRRARTPSPRPSPRRNGSSRTATPTESTAAQPFRRTPGTRGVPASTPTTPPPHRTRRRPRRSDRIVGAEVVVIVGFAREVDQLLQRERCRPGILGTQRVLGFRNKPLEGEPPARSLARRHPPVPAQVRARSRQRHEVVDLVPHRLRIDRRLRGTRRPTRARRLQARPRYAPARSPCRANRGSTVPSAGDPRRAPTPRGRTARGPFVSPTRERLSPIDVLAAPSSAVAGSGRWHHRRMCLSIRRLPRFGDRFAGDRSVSKLL